MKQRDRSTDVARQHTGKKQLSEADAYEYAHLGNTWHHPQRFTVYPCLWCDWFHVGHIIQRQRGPRRRP